METTSIKKPDTADLEQKVKKMYRDVALHPEGEYHFELGRGLAEKLGYEETDLDKIPSAAIESFAGVGYYFDMGNLKEGEQVLDLGSGSGMDVFVAALKVGKTGKVYGADMTDEQLKKAERLRKEHHVENIFFHKSYIEKLPFNDSTFDVVISNGVINLCPDKEKVFKEVSRVLKPGGRMLIADIVTEKQLPENVVCNSALWASCIGGASQQDEYKQAIESAGMEVLWVRNNDAYAFISKSAKGASKDYGVKSVSLLAEKKTMKSDKELIASGLACINLTPDIKKAISSMQGKEILKVTNDDPASRLGVPAWCRLTGNALLEAENLNEKETVFYIQKKNS